MVTGEANVFWCEECGRNHVETSAVGKRHKKHVVFGNTVEQSGQDGIRLSGSSECKVTGNMVNTNQAAGALRCPHCNDTGFIELDNIGLSRKFCVCGQETRDERIGVIPRRGHLQSAGPVSEDEGAEAANRVAYGTAGGSGSAAGDSGGQVAGEPAEPAEPAAPESDAEATGEVLPKG